jgi:SAM-dependent methyltransferase
MLRRVTTISKSLTRKRASTTPLCEGLFEKWDAMFETIDPTRIRRLEAVLDILGAHIDGPVSVLDLGSGPGSLTARILDRFPRSRVVAVDTDPVLLRVGKEALHRFGDRVTWVLADLRDGRWRSELPIHRFDAAASSLALNWLEASELQGVYGDLRRLIRPGGLVINADYLPSGRPSQWLRHLGKDVGEYRARDRRGVDLPAFKREWRRWWGALTREPSMRPEFVERQLRMPGAIPPTKNVGPATPVPFEAHERMLRKAGFHDAGVIWQDMEMRVLIGVR